MKTGDATRDKILAVASEQFAKYGFNGVSFREILRKSGVNTASGHYYFNSKNNLYIFCIANSADLISRDRELLLDKFSAETNWSKSCLTDLIAAYLGPYIRYVLSDKGHDYGLIMARLGTEPEEILDEIHSKFLFSNRARFISMLRRIFPEMDDGSFSRAVTVIIAIMSGAPVHYTHHLPVVPTPTPSELPGVVSMILNAATAAFWAIAYTDSELTKRNVKPPLEPERRVVRDGQD